MKSIQYSIFLIFYYCWKVLDLLNSQMSFQGIDLWEWRQEIAGRFWESWSCFIIFWWGFDWSEEDLSCTKKIRKFCFQLVTKLALYLPLNYWNSVLQRKAEQLVEAMRKKHCLRWAAWWVWTELSELPHREKNRFVCWRDEKQIYPSSLFENRQLYDLK